MVNQIKNTPKPASKPNKINPAPLNISSNIRGFCTSYIHIQSFLTNNSPDILAICETNLNSNIDTKTEFLNPGYLPLLRKDSETHMHSLGVYIQDNLPITRVLELEDISSPYMCFRLSLFSSFNYIFVFSITLHSHKTVL